MLRQDLWFRHVKERIVNNRKNSFRLLCLFCNLFFLFFLIPLFDLKKNLCGLFDEIYYSL